MSQIGVNEQTPREIVAELDKYIVGQHEAKRSVAIALRNRWRSRQLDADMREDIIPKNILMIGSTGVGKTEIARRLARLVRAPFLKVEATKFTEVGYVGRDVESIVRDLVETSVRMVRQQKIEEVEDKAKENAEERLIDVFVPPPKKSTNPLGSLFSSQEDEPEEKKEEPPKYQAGREWMRKRLRSGELENDVIEVEVEESARPMGNMFAGSSLEGMSDNLQSMIGKLVPKNRHKRKVTVAQARKIFAAEEADKLVDMDVVAEEAVRAAEYSGIVFLDEIDKVAVSNGRSAGADISREGVQRDILPIVEGSTVVTKYGPVKTDHVLFIAAGAFHTAKPSNRMPELQGRSPQHVGLTTLSASSPSRATRSSSSTARCSAWRAFLCALQMMPSAALRSWRRLSMSRRRTSAHDASTRCSKNSWRSFPLMHRISRRRRSSSTRRMLTVVSQTSPATTMYRALFSDDRKHG